VVEYQEFVDIHDLESDEYEGWGENVLAVGPPSTGKTTSILSLPGKKFLYVFDPNSLQALRPYRKGQDLQFAPFIADMQEVDISVKSLKKELFDKSGRKSKIEPRLYPQFERDFLNRVDAGFFDSYDWLCFDGMTLLSEMIMDRVQFINNRLGKHPEQGDWTAQMNTIRNLFRSITALRVHTYTTCHVETRRDENTGKTGGQLVLTGRLRTRMPQLFTQIFGCDADVDGDKGTFTIQTVKSKDWPSCRTNIAGLPPIQDVTMDFKKNLIGQGIGGVLMKAGRFTAKERGEKVA
jgi:hypothetical protein